MASHRPYVPTLALLLVAAAPLQAAPAVPAAFGTAPRAGMAPAFAPVDAGFLFRQDGLLWRAEDWKVFLSQGGPLERRVTPRLHEVKQDLLRARTPQELAAAEQRLAALEAELKSALIPGLSGLAPEDQARLVGMLEQRKRALVAMRRQRPRLAPAGQRQLDALKAWTLAAPWDQETLSGLESAVLGWSAEGAQTPLPYYAPAAAYAPSAQLPLDFSPNPSRNVPAPSGFGVRGWDSMPTEAEIRRAAAERGISAGILRAAISEARRQGVDYRLVLAVMEAESNGDPRALSPVGARGLMQVMPDTGRGLGVADARALFDPATNLRAGVRYLKGLWDEFTDMTFAQLGSIDPFTSAEVQKAVAAYNAGPGAVQRFRGVPPYRETREYVVRVLRNYMQYRRLFPPDPPVAR